MPTLLNAQATDGDGAIVDWNGNKEGTLQISGTWNGATVTIYGSLDDGTTFKAPTNSAYTEDVITSFQMGPGKVKATISSAGASTSLSAYISPG